MRRRSKKQETGAGFSLFSYLDGLLCTMGALIIVLICISRGARFSHKNTSGEPGDGPTAAELAEDLQNTEWRTKHMVEAREKTLKDLQDARLQLSHIEEHTSRLKKQFEELVAAEKALAENAGSASDEKLRSEVVRLRKAIADAEAEVDEARKRAESRKPSYAIVPYKGPNQTRRRPIYVECTGDRVILQPEGIELTPNDFAGPLGAGNPLAAVLRAEREFLYEQNEANHVQEEPYPLLLIRPDGIDMYVAAREAMQSWSSDFGYELIDQDWKLEYQPPNRELAEIAQSVVEEARKRQQFLARSMPRRAAEEQWYHAGEHGVVAEGGPGGGTGGGGPGRGGGRGGRRDPASSFVQRGGRSGGRGGASGLGDGNGRGNGVGNGARGHGDSEDSTGSGGYGAGGAGRAGGYPKGDGAPDGPNPYAGIAEGVGSGGAGARPGGTGSGGQGSGGVAGQPGGPSGKPVGAGAAEGQGTGAQGPGGTELAKNSATGPGGTKRDGAANSADGGAGTGPELGGPNGGANGQSGGGQSMAGGSGGVSSGAQGGSGGSGGAGGGQSAGQPGGAQSAATGGSSAPGGSGSAGTGAATGGGMPNLQFGAQPPPNGPQPDGTPQNGVSNRPNGSGAAGSTTSSGGTGGGSAQNSIASQQGKDWALPEESRHAVPIARPVVVECRADKLVVHADGATSKVVKEIPLRGATIDSVNELVGTVSQQAATWGPAGRGMYWQPSLSMQVAPGGEARYADLQKLMENSGLDVRPAQAPPKQVAKPKRWFGLVK